MNLLWFYISAWIQTCPIHSTFAIICMHISECDESRHYGKHYNKISDIFLTGMLEFGSENKLSIACAKSYH